VPVIGFEIRLQYNGPNQMNGRSLIMANSVVIVGRLGQDPEIKYFESGSVKARFSLAVDRGFSKENKVTDWFNIEVWGRKAEFVGEWIKKGALVSVTGQLEVNRYTDQAGNPKEWPLIRANDVSFVGTKRDNAAPMEAGAAF
jgi:single-strand DNA-binding protein